MFCSIIVPRQDEILRDDTGGYFAACILERGHLGPHVFRTPKGLFFAWEDDWGCDCCAPEETDRCFTYWKIRECDIPNLCEQITTPTFRRGNTPLTSRRTS